MNKILKNIAIILLIILLILIGRRIYYSTVYIEADDLYLTKENSTEQILANKGTYSWSDKGTHVNVDTVGPTEMEYAKIIEVKKGEKLFFNDCNWTNSTASIIISRETKELAKVSIECNAQENYIVIPDIALGEHFIEIYCESDKGQVWYSAKINIVE